MDVAFPPRVKTEAGKISDRALADSAEAESGCVTASAYLMPALRETNGRRTPGFQQYWKWSHVCHLLWCAHRTASPCGRQCTNAQFSVVVCALAHNLLWKSGGNDGSNTRKQLDNRSGTTALLDSPEESLENEDVPQSMSEKLAGIVLPDSGGQPVRLGSLWTNHPAVIAFLRHYG